MDLLCRELKFSKLCGQFVPFQTSAILIYSGFPLSFIWSTITKHSRTLMTSNSELKLFQSLLWVVDGNRHKNYNNTLYGFLSPCVDLCYFTSATLISWRKPAFKKNNKNEMSKVKSQEMVKKKKKSCNHTQWASSYICAHHAQPAYPVCANHPLPPRANKTCSIAGSFDTVAIVCPDRPGPSLTVEPRRVTQTRRSRAQFLNALQLILLSSTIRGSGSLKYSWIHCGIHSPSCNAGLRFLRRTQTEPPYKSDAERRWRFSSLVGQRVSVIATTSAPAVETEGIKVETEGVGFTTPYDSVSPSGESPDTCPHISL